MIFKYFNKNFWLSFVFFEFRKGIILYIIYICVLNTYISIVFFELKWKVFFYKVYNKIIAQLVYIFMNVLKDITGKWIREEW